MPELLYQDNYRGLNEHRRIIPIPIRLQLLFNLTLGYDPPAGVKITPLLTKALADLKPHVNATNHTKVSMTNMTMKNFKRVGLFKKQFIKTELESKCLD